MAIHAGERVLNQELALVVLRVPRLRVWHAGHLLEAGGDIALADEAIQGEVRRVALQARAGLLLLGHAARLLLVEEGVGVAAPIAIVDGKGVAGEDAPEPLLAVELLLRGAGVAGAEAAPAVLGRRGQRRLEVAVVLSGPVLAPDFGSIVSSVTSTRRT